MDGKTGSWISTCASTWSVTFQLKALSKAIMDQVHIFWRSWPFYTFESLLDGSILWWCLQKPGLFMWFGFKLSERDSPCYCQQRVSMKNFAENATEWPAGNSSWLQPVSTCTVSCRTYKMQSTPELLLGESSHQPSTTRTSSLTISLQINCEGEKILLPPNSEALLKRYTMAIRTRIEDQIKSQ
jgi:hypothetical protein